MEKGLQHSVCQMLPRALLNLVGLFIGLLLGLVVAKIVELSSLINLGAVALVVLFFWYALRTYMALRDDIDTVALIGFSVGFGINSDPSFGLVTAGLIILTLLTS